MSCPRYHAWLLVVASLLQHQFNVSLAFTGPYSPALLSHLGQQRTEGPWPARRHNSCAPLFLSESLDDEDEALLTDLDARVLQSMLQDEKLNLQEEDNMKRLLERGIKSREPVAQEAKRATNEAQQQAGDQEYSSKLLQTLGNTKLWKGLSRNMADMLESAKIWAANKVERDTKLVASLGVFALDRALQDVKRALPAAGSAAKMVAPKLFLLDRKSSADQGMQGLSSSSSTEDIRNRMTTPQDEIKSVTQEIKFIIQSGGERRNTGITSGSLPATLQSAASNRQDKDRFLKAYQRRKQTTLRREKENLAQTSARMAGSVIDSAYQVRRELEIEPNTPGFKSKALREGAAQTSKLLASGAKGLLSGAQAIALRGLQSSSTSASSSPQISSSNSGGMDATAAAMDAAMGKFAPPEQKKLTRPSLMDTNILDAEVFDVQRTSSVPRPPKQSRSVSDAPINARIPGTSSPYVTSTPSTVRGLYEAPPIPPDSRETIQSSERTSEDDDDDEEDLFFASRQPPDFREEEQTVSSLLNAGKKEYESTFSYFSGTPVPATGLDKVDEATSEVTTTSSFETDTTYAGDILFDEDVNDDWEEYFLDSEDPKDTLRRVMAEIVSDEDFEYAFGQAKRVDNTADQAVGTERQDKEPSLLTVILLRCIDVVFLVLEKIILAIPTLLSSLPKVVSRIALIRNQGGGSEGWETIYNAQRGDKRY